MSFYYGILFILFIIIGAERLRRRVCWTLGRRIRFFVRVCVPVRRLVSWIIGHAHLLNVFLYNSLFTVTIYRVAIDSESPSEQKISSRLLVTTSTDAVQIWTQGELKWVREESLANIVVAEFAELPEHASESSVDSTGKGFFARIIRQLVIAQVCIFTLYDANPHTYDVTGPSTIPNQLYKTICDWVLCLYAFRPVIPFITEELKLN
jgi:hypothetical protein